MRLRKGLRLPMLFACIAFLFLTSTGRLRAQTFNLQTNRDLIASLDGQWRFHTGDNPVWANPNFDDSQWPLLRSNEDWGKQGYKGYRGVAWYRFTIQVPEGNKPLSLLLPSLITSYQVFANGRLIGGCGGMPPHPVPHFCNPRTIDLPAGPSPAPQTIVFAIRVWHWKAWATYFDGGPRGTSYIGGPHLIDNRLQAIYDGQTKLLVQYYFLVVFALLGAFVSFALFLFRRADREYLWFGVLLLLTSVFEIMTAFGRLNSVAIVRYYRWEDLATSLGWFASLGFYYVLLRGRRSWPLYVALTAVSLFLLQHLLPLYAYIRIGLFNIIANLLMVPPILWILALLLQRAREKLLDARLLLVPVFLLYGNILVGGVLFATFQLGWQHRYADDTFSVLSRPFPLNSDVLTEFIFLVAMIAILVNRFTRTRREEERYASELEAGRNMQSMLIPVAPPNTPGFAVESVYLPASEVGGDFFQVQPGDDGSLLIVVGDVSGKGLKAAMTVSTIVGALRNETSRLPAEILAHLNRVLHGQIKGFVTCCATCIAADGAMTIANAGHIPPYRNGEELAIPSALPLGTIAESGYEETQFKLAPGDRLTFVSDGIIEATNDKRELFGFQRTQKMSSQSAAAIAKAAKNFGQEDDITVLSIQFAGAEAVVNV